MDNVKIVIKTQRIVKIEIKFIPKDVVEKLTQEALEKYKDVLERLKDK